MIKNVILMLTVLWAVCTSGSAAGVAEVKFTAPGLKIDSVYLIADDVQVGVRYDSNAPMQLSVNDFSGYATLKFGRVSKQIYLESGSKLEVLYKKIPGKIQTSYVFSGDLARENTWFDKHEQPHGITLTKAMTSAEAIAMLDNEAENCRTKVKAQNFSSTFTFLEGEREAYDIYRCFKTFKGWGDELYPFLKKQIKEIPELLDCSSYSQFMLATLEALSAKACPEYTLFDYIRFQLEFIAGELKNARVKSSLACTAICTYMKVRGVDRIEELMPLAQTSISNSNDKAEVESLYEKWISLAKGTDVKDYAFTDVNGKLVKLSDFYGKFVFIDCWATWCGPCRGQIAPLKKLEEIFDGKNIVFVGVSSDTDLEKWKAFIKEQKLPGIQVNIPANDEFFSHFHVDGIPRFILLDTKGKVYDAMMYRPSEPACKAVLDELL